VAVDTPPCKVHTVNVRRSSQGGAQEYDPTVPGVKPLFFYLPWQNVHAPYQVCHAYLPGYAISCVVWAIYFSVVFCLCGDLLIDFSVQSPLGWTGDVLRGMLSSTDAALGGVVAELKAKGMWGNTVIAYSADNGGTDRGNK
jgi:hypothetical protein